MHAPHTLRVKPYRAPLSSGRDVVRVIGMRGMAMTGDQIIRGYLQ